MFCCPFQYNENYLVMLAEYDRKINGCMWVHTILFKAYVCVYISPTDTTVAVFRCRATNSKLQGIRFYLLGPRLVTNRFIWFVTYEPLVYQRIEKAPKIYLIIPIYLFLNLPLIINGKIVNLPQSFFLSFCQFWHSIFECYTHL